jgi:uncharacterized protein YqhQ
LSIRSFLRLSAHVQMLPVLESGEETLVGGQAVMEGVMMRAPHSYCVAVRKPNGEIITDEKPLEEGVGKYPIFKYPILRGLGTLGASHGAGHQSFALLRERGPGRRRSGQEAAGDFGLGDGLNLAFSLTFFIFLYKFVPLWMATKLGRRTSR